jgi:hypothetical protein
MKTKNFTNQFIYKKYYGNIFLQPHSPYIEFMKKVLEKYKNTDLPKTLQELKRLALEEAKKISGKNKNDGEINITKEILIRILKALYVVVDPILIKINQTFKNERRKYYNDNEKYMITIQKYESQKNELIAFTLKSICKYRKLKPSTVTNTLFDLLKQNDEELIDIIHTFSKAGKGVTKAPKRMDTNEITDILKFYYENLDYLCRNSNDVIKYSFIILNDTIYEHYGLEEEQIFSFIIENELCEHSEIGGYLKMIKNLFVANIQSIYII